MTDVRPILSAADLRITPAEHQAMLEVRAHFAAGTFHHDHEAAADMPDGFNMDYADRETECGTTCCIGGWMFRVMRRDRTTKSVTARNYVSYDRSLALGVLFYPPVDDIDDMAYSTTLRAKWPGKRWHGRYRDIYEACDVAHDDGLVSFVIDYVTEED